MTKLRRAIFRMSHHQANPTQTIARRMALSYVELTLRPEVRLRPGTQVAGTHYVQRNARSTVRRIGTTALAEVALYPPVGTVPRIPVADYRLALPDLAQVASPVTGVDGLGRGQVRASGPMGN